MAKKKGLWSNIHAKRKRGESPAKKGDKNYPETLDIGEGAEQLDEISKKLARSYLDKSQKDIEARRTRGDKASKRGDTQYRDTEYMKSYDRERGQSRALGKIDGKRDKFPSWSSKVPATGEDPARARPKEKEKSKGIKGLVKRLTRKEEFVNEGLKKARKNVGADTCWDGYKAKGTKKKDGKEVPNCVKEGKIADRMRANLKSKKKEWDEKGNKAKKDGYDALDKVKKTQADLDKSDFINNIKEGKSFAEFCVEAKSRIETDPDYRKRFKALADNFAEKRKEQTSAKKTRKESVEILDVDGNMVAEITDLISPEPMSGWKQQNEDYKKLPKRKIGMKAGKKIISAVGHAAKAGEEGEGTIEDQIRMQKAGKKTKQAEKMHKVAGKHNETLSKMKSIKNKLKGLTKEEYVDEAAWTRKEGKNKAGGLNEKGRKSYERENPGSDLKAPQPEGGPRKRSFCARMGGMKGPLKDEKGEPTRKKLALDKWKC